MPIPISDSIGGEEREGGSSPNSAAPKSGILQLNPEVKRAICTQQVISDLYVATRELVDNALDAGATNIGLAILI